MHDPQVSRALILGAGRSGASAARLLRRLGVEPSVYDDNRPWDRKGRAAELAAAARLLGPGDIRGAGDFDLVVVSPGVPASHPIVKEAMARQIPVVGELEFAWSRQDLPVAAVTGSNGKSTVTELAHHILTRLGARSACAGNIGKPFSEVVLEQMEGAASYASAVLEVSSFQLETVRDFRPRGAAFINFSPDHIDRHLDMGEYFRLKCRIFQNQGPDDMAILNEDELTISLKSVRGRRFGFSRRSRPAFGAWVEAEGGREIVRVADGGTVLGERPWDTLGLRGAHNQENLMAAVGLAMSLGRGAQESLDAAVGFSVPDHRLEFVGCWNGIDWYDDSKGTNSGAVATALRNFRDGSVVLILGGRDKDMDFRILKEPVRAKVRHLILMGEARERIKSSLRGTSAMTSVSSMDEAVTAALRHARGGDTVLLSPACASFDMFSGYRERGEVFQREVRRQNENPRRSPSRGGVGRPPRDRSGEEGSDGDGPGGPEQYGGAAGAPRRRGRPPKAAASQAVTPGKAADWAAGASRAGDGDGRKAVEPDFGIGALRL